MGVSQWEEICSCSAVRGRSIGGQNEDVFVHGFLAIGRDNRMGRPIVCLLRDCARGAASFSGVSG
jgi:hypothetical protein